MTHLPINYRLQYRPESETQPIGADPNQTPGLLYICIRSGSAMAGPELTQRDPESAFGVCFSMFSVRFCLVGTES